MMKRSWIILGITLIVSVFSLLVFGVGTAFSDSPLLAFGSVTPTPAAPAGEAIQLKPLTELGSLTATAKINANGLVNGEKTQGDLNAVITVDNKGQRKITVTGSLLGKIATQVGGEAVGLFTPSSVDIYKVSSGSYIVVNSLVTICVKPSDPNVTEALEKFSPQGLLSMLTGQEVARGTLAGQEAYSAGTLKHYVLSGDAFLKAAKQSSDPDLKSFGNALWHAGDADLFVDSQSGYPMAYRNSFSGTFAPLNFEGDFDVDIQVTGVNTNPTITLPAACNNPIIR